MNTDQVVATTPAALFATAATPCVLQFAPTPPRRLSLAGADQVLPSDFGILLDGDLVGTVPSTENFAFPAGGFDFNANPFESQAASSSFLFVSPINSPRRWLSSASVAVATVDAAPSGTAATTTTQIFSHNTVVTPTRGLDINTNTGSVFVPFLNTPQQQGVAAVATPSTPQRAQYYWGAAASSASPATPAATNNNIKYDSDEDNVSDYDSDDSSINSAASGLCAMPARKAPRHLPFVPSTSTASLPDSGTASMPDTPTLLYQFQQQQPHFAQYHQQQQQQQQQRVHPHVGGKNVAHLQELYERHHPTTTGRRRSSNNKNKNVNDDPYCRPPIEYIPRRRDDDHDDVDAIVCTRCSGGGDEHLLMLCDRCNTPYHTYCLSPPLSQPPTGDWFCPACVSHMFNVPALQAASSAAASSSATPPPTTNPKKRSRSRRDRSPPSDSGADDDGGDDNPLKPREQYDERADLTEAELIARYNANPTNGPLPPRPPRGFPTFPTRRHPNDNQRRDRSKFQFTKQWPRTVAQWERQHAAAQSDNDELLRRGWDLIKDEIPNEEARRKWLHDFAQAHRGGFSPEQRSLFDLVWSWCIHAGGVRGVQALTAIVDNADAASDDN